MGDVTSPSRVVLKGEVVVVPAVVQVKEAC